MTRFSIAVLGVSMGALGVLAASCGSAGAQIVLPGAAAPAGSGEPADARPARKPDKPEKSAADFSVGVAAVVGRPLRLDGKRGRLLLSGHGKLVRIDKFSLPGEVISDPSQKCLIDIVGEAPIEAKNLGRPDGLARYQAEIPACPFSFDLLDGAVLVPAQSQACVFQAADCQASPSAHAPTRRRRTAFAPSRSDSKVGPKPTIWRATRAISPRDGTTFAAITRRRPCMAIAPPEWRRRAPRC
jgi:hypothetical protein